MTLPKKKKFFFFFFFFFFFLQSRAEPLVRDAGDLGVGVAKPQELVEPPGQ